MKLAIIGSRSFNDYDLMCDILSKYKEIKAIISGGARGEDSLAARYAQEKGIFLIEHLPNWNLGRHAGHLRNQSIIDECDRVVAFWDMKSTGTKDSIKKAKKQNKPVEVVNVNEYQNQLDFGE